MRGIGWFLVIAFGLAWAVWELAIRRGISVLSWQFQLFALPGAFAPAIAAFIVRRWITGEGFADAGLALRAARWPIYLFAWLLPLAVVAVITLEAIAFGIAQPDFTLTHAIRTHAGAGGSAAMLAGAGLSVVPQLMGVALLMTPLLWGEEFGWRGYLQPRLFPRRPVPAAIATGTIWAVWHYPLTLRGYDYPENPLLGTLLFTFFTILIAYIFGWIRARSGSIWASSLAHSATNTLGSLTLLWFAGSKGMLVIGYAGLLAIPPLLLVCLCLFLADRRRGKRQRERRG